MHEEMRLKKLKQLMDVQDDNGMNSEQRKRQFEYQAKLQEKMEANEMRKQLSVDEVFKNRNMTFDDIDKLNYKQFNPKRGGGGGADVFKPSDILDLDDNDDDDEILRKFKEPGASSPKRMSPVKK